jgi:diacylglycerol kinase family enzyme
VNVWILCNEGAGRSFSVEDVRHLVERAGHAVVGVAKEYDSGTPFENSHVDLLVAAGGDGTVATVAGIALRTGAALAILPLGTANNIAMSLGVKGAVADLIASWTNARRRSMDLGFARAGSKEWLMVEGAGGGLVPAGIAAAEVALRHENDAAPTAEVASAVRCFRDALLYLEPRPWTLIVDGKKISKTFLLVEVLNIRSVGPNLLLAPDADPSDGFFDVITAEPSHRDQLMSYLENRAEGRDAVLSLPRFRAREVVIESCAELHIDDERIDTCNLGPVSIRIEPAAITVLV